MKTLKSWAVLAWWGVGLTACSSFPTPVSPPNQVTVAPQVQVANEMDAAMAAQVALTPGGISAPVGVLNLEAGDFLFGNLGERFVMRKILAKSLVSGQQHFATRPARLDEVVGEGQISFSQTEFELTQTGMRTQSLDDRLKVKFCAKEWNSNLKATFVIEKGNLFTGVNIAQLSICPSFKFTFDAGKKESEVLINSKVEHLVGTLLFQAKNLTADQTELKARNAMDMLDLAAHLTSLAVKGSSGKISKVGLPIKAVPRLVVAPLFKRPAGSKPRDYTTSLPFVLSCDLQSGFKVAQGKPSFLLKPECKSDVGSSLLNKGEFEVEGSEAGVKYKLGVGLEYAFLIGEEAQEVVEINGSVGVEALVNATLTPAESKFSLGASTKLYGGLNLHLFTFNVFEEEFGYTFLDEEVPLGKTEMVEYTINGEVFQLPRWGGKFLEWSLLARQLQLRFDPNTMDVTVQGLTSQSLQPIPGQTSVDLKGSFFQGSKITLTLTPKSALHLPVWPPGCVPVARFTCALSPSDDYIQALDLQDNPNLNLKVVPYVQGLPNFLNLDRALQVEAGLNLQVGLWHVEALRSSPLPGTWTVQLPAVASLSAGPAQTMLLQGKTAGSTTLTATTENGRSISVEVRVLPAGIQITPRVQVLQVNETVQLQVSPAAPDTMHVWSSSNPAVLAVSSSGLLRALMPGEAVIQVAHPHFPEVQDRLNVQVTPAETGFLQVSTGGAHTCAVSNVHRVYCWGDNVVGQLGIIDQLYASTPQPVTGTMQPQKVVLGGVHSCGQQEQRWFCWGANHGGQLGDGSTVSTATPIEVLQGSKFHPVVLGGSHSCGIAISGRAHCWGANGMGQLGMGSSGQGATLPTAVHGDRVFSQLALGDSHSCGLTPDGKAYCWGANYGGQLGDGSQADRVAPQAVQGDLMFSVLVAGGAHSCGLTPEGKAYCWGNNEFGQLGDGSNSQHSTPVPVKGHLTWMALAAGGNHTCGLATDQTAHCWGSNEFGQLGDDSLAHHSNPVVVQGGHTFTQITTGWGHTCALNIHGQVMCWGSNGFGQLGDGSLTHQNRPVGVRFP